MTEELPTKRERTCAGCGNKADPSELVRLVLGPDGEIAVDAAGGAFGRGAHVHPVFSCIGKACRGGLSKAYKTAVTTDPKQLGGRIADAYLRRAEGLLVAAVRSRYVAVGADEAQAAMRDKGGRLLVVANDAASVVERTEFARAIAEGRACVWTSKARLGSIMGRDEVAVCAVTEPKVSFAISSAVRIADMARVEDR